jgi:hypothetical protein
MRKGDRCLPSLNINIMKRIKRFLQKKYSVLGKKYSLVSILVLLASIVLFSILFRNWDAIIGWLFR